MKDKTKLLHESKVFLNKKGFHSDANILTRVNICERETSAYTDTDLSIKDCHYKINLNIELDNKNNYDNTIYKLDKLISELTKFRTACRKARHWYLEAQERIKKRVKMAEENDKRKKSESGGTEAPRAAIPRGILRTARTRRNH